MNEKKALKNRAARQCRLGWVKPMAAAALLLLILLRPEAAVAGGQRAMRIWCASVAPALFPFLALMPMLTCREACSLYRRSLGWLMGLLGLPGEAAPAVLIGMLAGSPGGAIAARRVAEQSGMNRQDACRLALGVCGMSPAYLVIGVGQGLLGSIGIGWRLAGIQLLVQLILLLCLRGFRLADDEAATLPSADPAQPNGLRQAVESVLSICGYMVLFGSVTQAAASFVGDGAATALLAICDAPGGLAAIANMDSSMRIMLVGMVVGFGGLCIAVQNMDVLRSLGVKPGKYLCVRVVSALLVGGFCGIFLQNMPAQDRIVLNPMPTYAFSLLCAAVFAIPALVFLSKKPILNNQKTE